MKLNAAVKMGLAGGLVISLCLHLTVYLLFYTSAYQFSAPGWLETLLAILAYPLMLATALAVGPLAVRAAGDAARDWRQATLTGGGAGLVAGVVTYLLVMVLALVMVLGVVPLIAPLSDPASLARTRVDDLLRPVVRDAVREVYTSQALYLLAWTGLGAIEGLVFALVCQRIGRKAPAARQPGMA